MQDSKDVHASHSERQEEEIEKFRSDLLAWFALHRRHFYWRIEGLPNYVKVVSEVLLQRTQAAVVSNFLPVFLATFPDWDAIARSNEEEIGEVLKPLGLWRRRAVSLRALATEISRRGEAWPLTRAELESIPAVGQYVASAVLLFEHGKRTPLVDASTARLLRRYFAITPEKADIRYDKPLQAVAHGVLEVGDPIAINWAMLDFAAVQCKNNAAGCVSCALKGGCKRYAMAPNSDC